MIGLDTGFFAELINDKRLAGPGMEAIDRGPKRLSLLRAHSVRARQAGLTGINRAKRG